MEVSRAAQFRLGKTPLSSKYLVLVYREIGRSNGFVITAYFYKKTSRVRGGSTEAIKLFEKRPKAALNWDYDGEAEVLYLSFGEPRAAAGVDIGGGVILRYDEEKGEVVGLTILGLGSKLLNFLEEEGKRGLVAVLITLLVAVGGLVISGAAAGRS